MRVPSYRIGSSENKRTSFLWNWNAIVCLCTCLKLRRATHHPEINWDLCWWLLFPSFNFYVLSSLIPWFNSWRDSPGIGKDWEDKEFDQKNWTQGPSDFSCQALAESLKKNSTLMNLTLLGNGIGPEGAKAWCLMGIVREKGHREDQSTATSKQSQWNVERIREKCTAEWILVTLLISNAAILSFRSQWFQKLYVFFNSIGRHWRGAWPTLLLDGDFSLVFLWQSDWLR